MNLGLSDFGDVGGTRSTLISSTVNMAFFFFQILIFVIGYHLPYNNSLLFLIGYETKACFIRMLNAIVLKFN